ncbi:MAG TPA: MBL fold metallo-hydrolase, partial [Bacilli bacterium]|nr:MBL fold metallo-hydrolase [Bacilli bacterium]
MEKIRVQSLGHRIHIIDGYDLGIPNRTGSYILQEDELTIIETGPSISIPYLIKGLEELNVRLEDVKYVIATHIHLDHSGGAGLLLEKCPNAKIVVHPKAARHVIDPPSLIQIALHFFSSIYISDTNRSTFLHLG